MGTGAPAPANTDEEGELEGGPSTGTVQLSKMETSALCWHQKHVSVSISPEANSKATWDEDRGELCVTAPAQRRGGSRGKGGRRREQGVHPDYLGFTLPACS